MNFLAPKKYTALPTAKLLEELFEHVGPPVVWIYEKQLVAWPLGRSILHVRAQTVYVDEPRAPSLVRIAANVGTFTPSRRDLASLGFSSTLRPVEFDDVALRLTVREQQTHGLAPWLVTCIKGRIDPRRAIPAPPFAVSGLIEDDLYAASELWSRAARRAERLWQEEQLAWAGARHARAQWLRQDRFAEEDDEEESSEWAYGLIR